MEVGVSEFPFYVEGVAVGRGSRKKITAKYGFPATIAQI